MVHVPLLRILMNRESRGLVNYLVMQHNGSNSYLAGLDPSRRSNAVHDYRHLLRAVDARMK